MGTRVQGPRLVHEWVSGDLTESQGFLSAFFLWTHGRVWGKGDEWSPVLGHMGMWGQRVMVWSRVLDKVGVGRKKLSQEL